jgi:hypothetical protein
VVRLGLRLVLQLGLRLVLGLGVAVDVGLSRLQLRVATSQGTTRYRRWFDEWRSRASPVPQSRELLFAQQIHGIYR